MTEDNTKSIQQLLNQYKEELQGEAETDATKQFAKDLDDMAKEYDGTTAIVSKYQAAHANFVGPMMQTARIQRDEVQSWCNDPDEIPEALQSAIRALRDDYDQRAKTIADARDAAKTAFNDIKSRLDKAKAAEADALAAFTRTKGFEAQANGWFTDLANLHKAAKAHLDARNYRLVYAHVLEIEDIWANKLVRSFDDEQGIATPLWLLRKLNDDLRALIGAKRERYEAHKEWLALDKAAAAAQANYKYFIEDNNRRKEFLREAQDVEPAQPGSSPGRSEPAPQDRQQPEPQDRQQPAPGTGPYPPEPAREAPPATRAAA
jgi:hypothetical protein